MAPDPGTATAAPALWDLGDPAATATPVVLLHGWTGSKEDFEPVVDALAEDRRVLVPDLLGHGDSSVPADGDFGLGAHVRAVLDLLDRSGVADVHVVGHSHGGLVAQRVAYAAAHRVASLALVGTGLGALGDDCREHVVRVAVTARDEGLEAAWAVATEGDDGGDPRAAFLRRRFLSMPPEAILGVARNLVTATPLGAFLHGIDVPVLVCHGEGDTAWLPDEQRLLARRIRGAAYAVIPDALHSPAVENPQGLLDLLRPFLAAADR